MLRRILFDTWRTFGGSFSAVSAPPIARVGAFFSIFRALQGLRSAFLCTAIFCTISGFFIRFSAHFAIHPFRNRFHVEFWRNFCRILTKFCRNLTKFDELCRNLSKFVEFWRKIRQKLKKNSSKNCRINSSVRHFGCRTEIRRILVRAPPH